MADELFKGFNTPLNLMAADTTRDKVVGQDELGRTIYEAPGGRRYVEGAVQAPPSIPDTAKAAYDAIPPMEDWRLPTTGEAVDAGKSIVKSAADEIWNLVSAPTNPDATMGDVIGIVSSMGSPAAVKVLEDVVNQGVDVYDPTTLRMFFGPESKTADYYALQSAKQMEKEGRKVDEIWESTGWWNGPNGWKYEVSDHDAEIHPAVTRAALNEPQDGPRAVSLPLEDGVDHEEFFKALPDNATSSSQLQEGKLRLQRANEMSGSYNSDTGTINIKGQSKEQLRSVLLHEMQHMEQAVGGSPSLGANPAGIYRQLDNTLKELPREALEYLATRREIDMLVAALDVKRQNLRDGVKPYEQNDTLAAYTRGLDEDGLTETITELKRQRNETKTNFEKQFGPEFKKSLDDLYTITGGFTDLVRDHDASGVRTPVSPQERATKLNNIAFDLYERNAGEVEARLTASRRNFTPEQRASRAPYKDYDLDPSLIVDEFDVRGAINNVSSAWDNIRSKRRYAEGGVVENTRVDPVSGNAVPPGATPKEVRDDVDIKASEGEYIIPANVVRFLGLDKIEKMVNQAKEKLVEMEAAGRMGGEAEDDLPFGPEDLMTTEGQPAADGPAKMATGGLVVPGSQSSLFPGSLPETNPLTNRPLWEMTFGTQPPPPVAPPAAPGVSSGAGSPTAAGQANRLPFQTRSSDEGPERRPTTGLAGSVDTWTPEDFVKYQAQKGSVGEKAVQGLITLGLPMGGLMVRARQGYLDRTVPDRLNQMIKTGKDLQGNPLSREQLASLRSTATKIEPREEGPKRGLSGLFSGLFSRDNKPVQGNVGKTTGVRGGETKSPTRRNQPTNSKSVSIGGKSGNSPRPSTPSKPTSNNKPSPSNSKSSPTSRDKDAKSGRR